MPMAVQPYGELVDLLTLSVIYFTCGDVDFHTVCFIIGHLLHIWHGGDILPRNAWKVRWFSEAW